MDGRRVLVVGASSGIGAAVVRAVAARGAAVTVSARRRERLEALVDEMGTGHAAQGDATVPAAGRAPDRRFMRVVMGNTAPTEFSNHMNVDLLGEALEAWELQAVPGGMMHVDDVGATLADAFAMALDHPDIDFPEFKLDARTA